MFCVVIFGTAAFQVVIMLVPGIRDVFDVYTCGSSALKECNAGSHGNEIPSSITWQTWLLCIGLAAGVMVVHLLGRLFIRTKREFPVSAKREAKDLEALRKRDEAKKAKEEEEA